MILDCLFDAYSKNAVVYCAVKYSLKISRTKNITLIKKKKKAKRSNNNTVYNMLCRCRWNKYIDYLHIWMCSIVKFWLLETLISPKENFFFFFTKTNFKKKKKKNIFFIKSVLRCLYGEQSITVSFDTILKGFKTCSSPENVLVNNGTVDANL